MIRTSTGHDVERLLGRVGNHPDQYSEFVVCTPFVDDGMLARLVRLAEVVRRAQCGFVVITRPEAASKLRAAMPGHPAAWKGIVIGRPDLHAKVYLAVARLRNESEVIVTSANLTSAGVETNIELGVRVRPSTDHGRSLLADVRNFLERLAAA
jgi:hypothetical protein